jgi:hypothetical protein
VKTPSYYYTEAANLRVDALRLERQVVDKKLTERRDQQVHILRMAAVVYEDLAKQAERLR